MIPNSNNMQEADDAVKQFFLLMSKKGEFSLWFVLLLFLSNLPGLCIGLLSFVFIKDDDNFMVICNIPKMQNALWSLSEIHNLTSDELNICKYRDFDYTHLSNLGFDETLQYSKSLSSKPLLVKCERYLTYSKTHATIFSDFNLVCDNWSYHFADSLGNCLADIIAGILIMPLGDILGRRRLIAWGIAFFFAGDLCVNFAVSHVMLGTGWFLISLGYRLTKLSTEIILLETVNSNYKKTFFFLTSLGKPLGHMSAEIFYSAPCHWRHLFVIVSSCQLLLPIVELCFPESARWMFSKNRKTKAFAILQSMKQPEIQEELLQRYRNFDTSYLRGLEEHLRQLMPAIGCANFFCIGLLFIFLRMTMVDTFQWKMTDDFKPHEKLFIFGLFAAQIIAALLPVFLFLVITKEPKFIVTPFMLLAGLFYAICCFLRIEENLVFTIIFLLANLLSGIGFLCASFHVLEMSPTSHTATVGGLIISTTTGIAKFVLLFSIKYLKTQHLCWLLVAACLVGASFSFVVKTANEEASHVN